VLRDAAAGDVAGPHEGYMKTSGVVVASSCAYKCTTVHSMRLSTRRPLPDMSEHRLVIYQSNQKGLLYNT
jgi:hypothetical protein